MYNVLIFHIGKAHLTGLPHEKLPFILNYFSVMFKSNMTEFVLLIQKPLTFTICVAIVTLK